MKSIWRKNLKIPNPRLRHGAGCRSFQSGSTSNPPRLHSEIFKISDEVYWGVRDLKPVVALETTIYTHGFPYPDNVALASHLESVVRSNGGIPATIGVLHGVARVGISPEELIELASAAGKAGTMKISRRDLPYITGLGMTGKMINGGTTIAGTMFLADLAGIRVFGTGGLGGVHRGGEHTMDVSADLTELGRTPVAVIGSGCKSFLDIPRTLEYLETQGVSVSTFADGRTGDIDLPAFWTRESGVRSPSVVQDEREAAAIIFARRLLNLNSGLFFANPIPLEHSLPKSDIDRAIDEAIRDAEHQGIHGHANTPFILDRIKQLTEGKSIPANRALIESNVARATKVAVEYSKLVRGEKYKTAHMPGISDIPPARSAAAPFVPVSTSEADILVAGSVAVDLSCDYTPLDSKASMSVVAHTSNPAVITQNIGGVGHNVATAAHLIGNGTRVRLCSIVGDDVAGKAILLSLKEKGLEVSSIMTQDRNTKTPLQTAHYVAFNDANKDLAVAMADMRIISSPINDFAPWKAIIEKSKPKWVVVDANWSESAIFQWTTEAKKAGASVAIEPVSVEKAKKLFPPKTTGEINSKKGVYPNHDIDLATPNEHELTAMYTAAKEGDYLEQQDWWQVIDALGISSTGITSLLRYLTSPDFVDAGIPQRMIQLLPFMPSIITKLGARGVLTAQLLPQNHPLLSSPQGAPFILSRNTNTVTTGATDPVTDTGHTSNREPPAPAFGVGGTIGGIYLRHHPAVELVPPSAIVSVNGVGDTFLGVLVAGLAKGAGTGAGGTPKGVRLDEGDGELIRVAQRAAVMTLKSREAVAGGVGRLGVELGGGLGDGV